MIKHWNSCDLAQQTPGSLNLGGHQQSSKASCLHTASFARLCYHHLFPTFEYHHIVNVVVSVGISVIMAIVMSHSRVGPSAIHPPQLVDGGIDHTVVDVAHSAD